MEATNNNTTPRPTSLEARWRMLGSDRFYAGARWFMLLLMLAVAGPVTGVPLLPPTLANPYHLIVWLYAVFTILSTIVLLIWPEHFVSTVGFLVDIAVLTWIIPFSGESFGLFYPLYFLPLVSMAMQLSPRICYTVGILTALAYLSVLLLTNDGGGLSTEPIVVTGAMLRAFSLLGIPLLTNGLALRSSLVNKQSVMEAERETAHAWSEARAYRDQMRALYEVAYTLSTTMNYQSVLDSLLNESRKLVPYHSAAVLLSTGEPDELYIAAAYGLQPADLQQRVSVGEGTLRTVLRSGDATTINDISKEAEIQTITAFRTNRSACLIPLRAALRSYGMMVVVSANKQRLSEEQIGMLTALSNYAIIALHNAQLVSDLRDERNKLLSKEEEVRHQLARDLHDGPAQALAAIAMNTEFIKRLLERDPDRVLMELEKLGALARRTTHEVRTLLFELRPLVLETQGLDTTLRQYFTRLDARGAEIIVESEPISTDIDTKTEGTLFNIIQEAVNNAIKHAEAKHIWVRLKHTSQMLEAMVEDDGRGFDMKRVLNSYEQRNSFGLLNIEERAKLVNGSAELHSTPGEGTTVRVVVPLHS